MLGLEPGLVARQVPDPLDCLSSSTFQFPLHPTGLWSVDSFPLPLYSGPLTRCSVLFLGEAHLPRVCSSLPPGTEAPAPFCYFFGGWPQLAELRDTIWDAGDWLVPSQQRFTRRTIALALSICSFSPQIPEISES